MNDWDSDEEEDGTRARSVSIVFAGRSSSQLDYSNYSNYSNVGINNDSPDRPKPLSSSSPRSSKQFKEFRDSLGPSASWRHLLIGGFSALCLLAGTGFGVYAAALQTSVGASVCYKVDPARNKKQCVQFMISTVSVMAGTIITFMALLARMSMFCCPTLGCCCAGPLACCRCCPTQRRGPVACTAIAVLLMELIAGGGFVTHILQKTEKSQGTGTPSHYSVPAAGATALSFLLEFALLLAHKKLAGTANTYERERLLVASGEEGGMLPSRRQSSSGNLYGTLPYS